LLASGANQGDGPELDIRWLHLSSWERQRNSWPGDSSEQSQYDIISLSINVVKCNCLCNPVALFRALRRRHCVGGNFGWRRHAVCPKGSAAQRGRWSSL